MPRQRLWVIITAVLLSLFATLLPVLAANYLSWLRATDLEQSRLSEVNNRLITRVRQTYSEAEKTLFYLNDNKTTSPCSAEHILLMRKATINNPMIEEVGYIEGGNLICGTWGTTKPIPTHFTNEITYNGVKISLNGRSIQSPDVRMVSLRFGSYFVLVNASQFSSIVIDPKIKIAVLSSSGVLVTAYNNPDLTIIKNYINAKNKPTSDDDIISVVKNERFTAVAMEHKSNFYETLSKQQLALLPLGLILALPLIGVIIYFSRRRLSIESELKYALDNNKLRVYYQPIVDLKDGSCTGAEALIRWFTSTNESISPDYFVAVAEKAGFISKITKYVINEVINDMQATLVKNKNLHISINFSVSDFHDTEIMTFLEDKLNNSGIEHEQIWLEITERQIVSFETTRSVMDEIRLRGYKFAMDDFGTGYSNLSYLKNLTLDILKIDKSFVDTIGMNTVTSGITDDIINMSKRLNLKIVAEGIESTGQYEYLLARGVEYGQGWLFSKALSRDDFIKYLEKVNKSLITNPDIN